MKRNTQNITIDKTQRLIVRREVELLKRNRKEDTMETTMI